MRKNIQPSHKADSLRRSARARRIQSSARTPSAGGEGVAGPAVWSSGGGPRDPRRQRLRRGSRPRRGPRKGRRRRSLRPSRRGRARVGGAVLRWRGCVCGESGSALCSGRAPLGFLRLQRVRATPPLATRPRPRWLSFARASALSTRSARGGQMYVLRFGRIKDEDRRTRSKYSQPLDMQVCLLFDHFLMFSSVGRQKARPSARMFTYTLTCRNLLGLGSQGTSSSNSCARLAPQCCGAPAP